MHHTIFLLTLFGSVSPEIPQQTPAPQIPRGPLYISLNIDDGSKLELSDKSTYEIAPDDRIYSKYWITPVEIEIGKSGDDEYPITLTNTYTGTSVKAKKIPTEKIFEKKPKKPKATIPTDEEN